MRRLLTILKKLKFCIQFGNTLKDGIALIRLTMSYSMSVRSSAQKYKIQSDQEVFSIQVRFNNKSFPLCFRRQDISMLYEIWMDKSYKIEPHQIPKGLVIDLGAHVGFTTLYFWSILGDGRSYVCVEGSSKNAEILKQNLSIISDTHIMTEVITSDGRNVNFYDEVSGHLHQIHDKKGKSRPSIALQELLSPYRQTTIALCKMDVEGIEYELLTQNQDWLYNVQSIHLELHHPSQSDKLISEMKASGFNYNSKQEILVFEKA